MSQEFLIQNSWLIALAVGSGLMLIWPVLTKGGGTRVTVPQATLLINQKNGTFRDAGFEAEVAFNADGVARAGMGVDAGDVQREEPVLPAEGGGWVIFIRTLVTCAQRIT